MASRSPESSNPTDFFTKIDSNASSVTAANNYVTEFMDMTLIRRSTVEIVFNSILIFFLLAAALFGNVLVIVAIYSSNQLRDQVSNILVVNLSCTDMLSALVVMSTSMLALISNTEDIPQFWCDVCCAVNYICIIVSMLTLAFISIDRYFAILHALSYPTIMTKTIILIMCGYSWFQGVAFAAPPAILQWVRYDYWEAICAIDWHKEKDQAVYYVIVACILCFFIPGIIMMVAYSFIIRAARKVAVVMPQNVAQNQPPVDTASKKAAKTVRSLLIVVLFFFICMTPFCITKLLKVVHSDKNFVPTYANLTASYFQYISSGINPFIYAIFRADFRDAFKRIIQKITLT